MAGEGWRQFTTETLASTVVQGYLMDQAVMAFDSVSQRTAELTVPQAGMVSYLRDSDTYQGRTPSSAGVITGGTWRGFARHWGSVTGALPTATSGNPATAQVGDTVYSTLWRCTAVVSFNYKWRQLDVTEAGTIAGRGTLTTDAAAGGAPFPQGFRIYVTGNDRLYEYTADGTWRLVGGKAGTAISLGTTGGAAQTGWGALTGTLQHHGNGMATVYAEVTRAGADVVVSSIGEFANMDLVLLPAGWEARAGVPLASGSAGRMASGHMAGSSRMLQLAAVGNAINIVTGNTISLGGTYALAAPQDLND